MTHHNEGQDAVLFAEFRILSLEDSSLAKYSQKCFISKIKYLQLKIFQWFIIRHTCVLLCYVEWGSLYISGYQACIINTWWTECMKTIGKTWIVHIFDYLKVNKSMFTRARVIVQWIGCLLSHGWSRFDP